MFCLSSLSILLSFLSRDSCVIFVLKVHILNLGNLSDVLLIEVKLLIDKIKLSLSVKIADEPFQNDDKNKGQTCERIHASIDSNVMVRLNSNSTLDQNDSYIENSDLQLVNSPSRSIRRCLSNASDDDHFQLVTSKKSITFE